MTKVTPIRKIKEGAKGNFYEAKVRCGKIKIIIADGDDGYPVRLTAQYSGGGGCSANLEAIQRLVTLLLECNTRADCIIEQLDKVICQSCRSAFVKGDKEISLSCGKALAGALRKHLRNYEENKAAQQKENNLVGAMPCCCLPTPDPMTSIIACDEKNVADWDGHP